MTQGATTTAVTSSAHATAKPSRKPICGAGIFQPSKNMVSGRRYRRMRSPCGCSRPPGPRPIPTTCGPSRSMRTYCARSAFATLSPTLKRSKRLRRFAVATRPAPRAFACLNSAMSIWGTYSPTRLCRRPPRAKPWIGSRTGPSRPGPWRFRMTCRPTARKRGNVVMTIERDGVRVQAASNGPAHILLPVQFSHCLVVVNGAPR